MANEERILHQGRVVDADGRPAAEALAFVATGTTATPEVAIRCDADGRFRLALAPGRYVVAARSAAGHEGSAEIETAKEAQRFTVVLGR